MILTVGGLDPSLRNLGLAKATYDTDNDHLAMVALRLQPTEKQSGKTIRSSSDDLRCAGLLVGATHVWIADCAAVFAEIPSGAQSARAAFGLGIALGVLGSVGNVGSFRGRLIQVTPQDVKVQAVGSKNASKHEMIEWAMERWPNLPWLTKKVKGVVSPIDKNEHLADACGAINAGIKTDEFKSIIQIVRATQPIPGAPHVSQAEYHPSF